MHVLLQVPDPGEACLPGREGRVAPEREVVMAASEQTKRRLGLLSQPHWTGVCMCVYVCVCVCVCVCACV